MNQPLILAPWLRPVATCVSYVFVIAATIAANQSTFRTLLDPSKTVADRVIAGSLLLVQLGGATHLAISRSPLKAVDDPPKAPVSTL